VSGDRGWRFILFLRKATAVLLAAACLAVVIRFATHWKRPESGQEAAGSLPAQKVASQEEPLYREYNRDLSRMEILAARNSLGPDGLYHLEGVPGRPVTVVDRGAKGGRDLRFTAMRVDYAKDWTTAVFSGGVSIETRGLTIRAETFDYDQAVDRVSSRAGATIRSEKLRGEARSLAYSLGDDAMTLRGDVRFALTGPRGDEAPYSLAADRMTFHYAQRRCRLDGHLALKHGRTEGQADAVEIQLFPDRDDVHILWLMGGVRASVREGSPADAPSSSPVQGRNGARPLFALSSREQDVAADHLMLTVFPDAPAVNIARVRGRVSLCLAAADGGETQLAGDALTLSFRRDKRLETMNLRGSGGLTSREPGRSGEARLTGSPVLYDIHNGVYKAFGSRAAPAVLAMPEREIQADWILIFENNNNVNAGERVFAVVKRRADDPVEPGGEGFFKPDKPAFVQSGFLAFTAKSQSLFVRTGVRMWQDDQVLESVEAVLNADSEALEATGGVAFRFVRPAGEGRAAAPVIISADRMDFDPSTRRIVFRGRGILRTRDAEIRAQTLTVLPEKVPGKARSVRAEGGVIIRNGDRKAFGETAEFDVEKDAVILTGSPYLIDKEKGTIRGDKLTFHLSDGTIEVENRSQRPSEIVIKT